MNTGDDVLVREAMQSDTAELALLRWNSRLEGQLGHSRADFLTECEAWLHEALASSQWIMAVAESEPDSLCGCMFMQCVTKVPAPGAQHRAWGYVTNSFVEPEHRGRGIGQELLQLLIEGAQSRALEFLIVWPSEASVAFYQRAGFRPVSEVHAGPDDEPPLELILTVAVGPGSSGTA